MLTLFIILYLKYFSYGNTWGHAYSHFYIYNLMNLLICSFIIFINN